MKHDLGRCGTGEEHRNDHHRDSRTFVIAKENDWPALPVVAHLTAIALIAWASIGFAGSEADTGGPQPLSWHIRHPAVERSRRGVIALGITLRQPHGGADTIGYCALPFADRLDGDVHGSDLGLRLAGAALQRLKERSDASIIDRRLPFIVDQGTAPVE